MPTFPSKNIGKGEIDNRKEVVLGADDKDFQIRELADQIRVKNDLVRTLTKSNDDFKQQVDDLLIMLEESAENPPQNRNCLKI